ncbi:MAG: hypothetical protein RR894_18590 [Terrisporobacter sp.]
MSKKSDLFEQNISDFIGSCDKLPSKLPDWMIALGIKPNAKIISSSRIGSKSKDNKTDVIINLDNCTPIKISAKLSNADYFGNWYGHKRFIEEFSSDTFEKVTAATTLWANAWILNEKSSPFIGVSISFGRRSGQTGQHFLDYFSVNDILTIVKGFEDDSLNKVANCLYIDDKVPKDLNTFISNLRPITLDSIKDAVDEFKLIYRPVNPLTSYSDRGKNVYTQFIPYSKSDNLITVTSKEELCKLGKFYTVKPTSLNHNHIIKSLKKDFNILIPVKVKEKKKKK